MDLEGGTLKCRVCTGETQTLFTLPIMGKYEGTYRQCLECGTLQVENPHWLREAYTDSHLTLLDVGALHRGMNTWAGTHLIMDIWGFTRSLDWGTGDGLLPRYLRDRGFDAYGEDKYSPRTHCRAFTPPPGWTPQIITAWEVWEHWENPGEELDKILSHNPEVHLFSTELWRGQGRDWGYLAPTEGQHITFYTPDALRRMSESRGYAVYGLGRETFIMFRRTEQNMIRAHIATALWNGWRWESLRGTLLNSSAPGIGRDAGIVLSQMKGERGLK